MNVEEYISTGILEAYVLDQLSASERAEVEKMATAHPEIREEIDRIELTIEGLAFATAVKPKKDIKSKLLSQLDDQDDDAPVIPMNSGSTSGSFMKYAAAASVIIAIGSLLMAFNYWSKWQGAEDRLVSLMAQNQQFAENYNMVNQQLDNLQGAVAIMNNSAYRRVVMSGTDNAPQALATVYWNESTADVYLSIQNLKDLSQDQQYQLWAIIDGKPVDAGVFNSDMSQMLVQMKNIGPNAAAFAVTIEPKGGSENPSLETMQVLGNV